MNWIVPFLVLAFTTSAYASEDFKKVDAFVEATLAADLGTRDWSEKSKAETVELNKTAGTSFDSGIGYAATVTKMVKADYSKIKEMLRSPGGILKISKAVKTQKNVVQTAEGKDEIQITLDIDVPVLSDFKTQDRVRIYEDSKGRGVLEWRQIGAEGHLEYNRGMVIVEAAGADKCRVFVLGVHILKYEHKIPWLGRGTANSFAKDHYSNYIVALEKSVGLN